MKISGKYKYWLLTLALIIVPFYSLPAQAAKKKAKQYTVVLDAGHGGKDIGATDHGIREKDINLAVARKLGSLLKKDGINVVYTREKDVFLSLQERANIANRNKADLFISIHTNSVDHNNPNRNTVSGASVYTLGLEKGGNNMSVARRENAVICLEGNSKQKYQGFDPNSDESYIIFEMVQKDNLNSSIMLANNLQTQLVKTAGRKDRGVHQAGFWVLWATSMPSALVELDFICNPDEAKFLSSASGQEKMAKSLHKGIKKYISDQKKLQAQAPKAQQDNDPAGFDTDATIGSVENERLVSEAPKAKNHNNAPRKRRNAMAAKVSGDRDIDVAVIQKQNPYLLQHDVKKQVDTAQIADNADNQEDKVPDKVAEDKNVKHNKQHKEVTPAKRPAKQEAKRPAKQANKQVAIAKADNKKKEQKQQQKPNQRKRPRLNSYYCVKLFESTQQLNIKEDPRLQDISGEQVSVRQQDGKYVYTIGHCEQRQDTLPIINTVKNRFPQAQIVRVNTDRNRIVQ